MAERPDAKSDPLTDLVRRHKAGAPIGMTSVCSAHPLVLDAVMAVARETDDAVLVEATSNQVDQDGGYTGMRPRDFRALVLETAARHGVREERIVLGGDHLGPNPWRDRAAEEAMTRAEELVAAFTAVGFTKLHLDCSMSCADDPVRLTDEVVSRRTARLMRVAEHAAAGRLVSYVIGTEVPPPGGTMESIEGLLPTSAWAAARTLAAHQRALEAAGLQHVWSRILALVVQPGVEFDEFHVIDYDDRRTEALRGVLANEPNMVFEAHSTDYQTPANLASLVRDHWAILKVGPALTFALREALFALSAIEDELVDASRQSRLPDVLEERMLADPGHWKRYHPGDLHAQKLARRFSYYDRLRYYWPDPGVRAAEEQLLSNLDGTGIPLPLLSQYLPAQYARVRDGSLALESRALALDRVGEVVRLYRTACVATDVASATCVEK